MQDSRRETLVGPGVPLRGNDIDTDRIIPARFLRTVTFEGLGDHAFEDDRLQLKEQGKIHPFDDPRFANGTILFVNKNFGCGSSREHAPQAIKRWGNCITAIVGESFAEIFFGNCVSLGVPCVTVDASSADAMQSALEADPNVAVKLDLAGKTIHIGARSYPVEMGEGPRQQLVEGRWDTTGELLANMPKIREIAHRLKYVSGYK